MAVKPHWLSPSGRTWSPSVVISFDTETAEHEARGHSVQRLRCWDAVQRVRHRGEGRKDLVLHHQGEKAAELADVIEAVATGVKEVWVIAHNLGFDLAVTSLPFVLADRGWSLDSFHLGDESTWWVLTQDGHKLVVTDSWSWLRCSLDDAAKDVRRRKARLPKDADDLATWHHRCRIDAEILDQIMVTLMDWWDENQLGVFGITGAACGWRTLRKIIAPRKVLVGPDGDRTAFERLAVYSGRKEVYGVGEFHDTWIADYDFAGAYPTAAAGFPLPVTPAKKWTTTDQLLDADPPAQRDYIAEVEITTHRPVAPCRLDGEVWWPVGTFRTVLAGPEVRYCVRHADSVRVIRWHAYRTGYALADWAGWCLRVQNAPAHEVPPVVARVAKGWGRSVIGRFAARTSRVVAERPSTHLGWHLETGHDLDTGAACEWLSMGGVERTILKDVDGADVFPAVLAFVEAHVRVALAEVMDAQPPELILQCNTDGWWQAKADRRSNYRPPGVPWPFTVVRKALERRLLVRGPNHVLTPHERRYAGIPAVAIGELGGPLHWRDWPGLRWQLEHGKVGEYHRPDREAVLAQHYVRRWVLTTGETIPVTMALDSTGSASILPWWASWGQRATDVLAPYQVPTLQRLVGPAPEGELGEIEPLPRQPGRDFPSVPRGGESRSNAHDGDENLTEYPVEAPPTLLAAS